MAKYFKERIKDYKTQIRIAKKEGDKDYKAFSEGFLCCARQAYAFALLNQQKKG